MKTMDVMRFSGAALAGFRTRTLLVLLAMSIGVASVVVLTSLGEGARRYVVDQFASLGTHLLIVLPGRSETTGGHPPLLGMTPRDLTLEDALSLQRSSSIRRIAPVTLGSAPVSWGGKERDVSILGSTAAIYKVRQLEIGQGQFLPSGDPRRGANLCVLGHALKKELFGSGNALGEWLRISDRRFRVIGILKPKGQSLGVDIGDIAIIPVASAQALFDTSSLFRILVQAQGRESIERAKEVIIDTIRTRHEGEDDVTVITQDAVLATFDRILVALTATVAGIAAISLVVAGILIMNVMLVSVSQRTAEIGLLKALGSPGPQIMRLFLTEAALLSIIGALCGLGIAWLGMVLLGRLFPDFPVQVPAWAFALSVAVALGTGLGFGALPARRAARMDAVQALSRR